MFHSPVFHMLMGRRVVIAPPVSAIALAPANPGDMGTAPQMWTAEVTATGGLTQVKWLVGINGAKTVTFARGQAVKTVQAYNHGDTINFTGFGTGVTIAKDNSGANNFFVQGSLGSETVTIPTETRVMDIRYTFDGAGGTGPIAYTVLNLSSGKGTIQATFTRPGDTLVVKSTDETLSAISGPVSFSGAVAPRIELIPHGPGDLLTAPASWTTRVNVVGLTQVHWIVLDSNFVGSGTTSFTVVNIVNNSATITCNLLKPGDMLIVKNLDNTVEDVSDPVIFSQGAKSVSFSPTAPGNLGSQPPAVWTTTVTTTNLPQFKWAIADASGNPQGEWFVVNSESDGTTAINVTFTASSQRLIVRSIDDSLQQLSSTVSFNTAQVPSDDAAFVRAWRDPLTVGVNIERDLPMSLDTAYYQRLVNDTHITHVRMFLGTKRDWGWADNNRINSMLDAVSRALAAGIKVQLGCMDVVGEGDVADWGAEDMIRRIGPLVAARNFDPTKFTINPWNEFGGSNNETVGYYAEIYINHFRNALGSQYVLSSSPAQWGDDRWFTDSMKLFPGQRMLYEYHRYPWEAWNHGEIDEIGNRLLAFEQQKGITVINGEWAQNGQGGAELLAPEVFLDIIGPATTSPAARHRLNWWTVTYGGWYRMNNCCGWDNFEMRGDIAALLRNMDSYIRNQSWWQSEQS